MEERNAMEDKIRKFIETYAKAKGYALHCDEEYVENIISSLAHNQAVRGARYCPCRVSYITENICPCKYHEEEIRKQGHCHCKLFFAKEYVQSIASHCNALP